MARSSSRHRREFQGEDSAGHIPPDFGEKGNDPLPPILYSIPKLAVTAPVIVDMSVYVRTYGSAPDPTFSLSGDVPSGVSIDSDGLMQVSSAYGSYDGFNLVLSSSAGISTQPITMDVYEEFYANRELTGGAASGPIAGANPPTGHEVGFPNADAAPLAPDENGFVRWEFNPNEATNRIYLAKTFSNVDLPQLQVGDRFRLQIEVEKMSASGTGGRAVVLTGNTGITITDSKVNCTDINQITICFFEFTIDDATWSAQFRFGLGTTVTASEYWEMGYPSLRNII